jgi:ATP-dependent Clp protease ATP-binding subunit ClpA
MSPMSAVMQRALLEAIRLEHRTVGTAHVALALLDEGRPSVAQDVLREHGVDRARIEASATRHRRDDNDVPRGSAVTGPTWHETAGRAQGFAATLGEGAGDPEQVLLSLLWEPRDRWFAELLASAGTSREAMVAALAARGVPGPHTPPPDLPPPKTQAAAFPTERLNDVNRALRRSHPNLHWGIGSHPEDGETSVVLAADDVDLAAVLDDVVGKDRWSWRTGTPK